jgi:hypothetical protein
LKGTRDQVCREVLLTTLEAVAHKGERGELGKSIHGRNSASQAVVTEVHSGQLSESRHSCGENTIEFIVREIKCAQSSQRGDG